MEPESPHQTGWIHQGLREVQRSHGSRLADIQTARLPHHTAIITDVRYPNEADYIKGQGGTVVRVVRGTDSTDQHSSETAMDDYPVDFTINNCGTLKDLAVETNRIWEEINGVRR